VVNCVTQYEYNSDITTKFRWNNTGDFGLALEHFFINIFSILISHQNHPMKNQDQSDQDKDFYSWL